MLLRVYLFPVSGRKSVGNSSIDLDPLLPPNYDEYQIGNDNEATLLGVKIQAWMDRCVRSHSKCPKPARIRADFPTRLIQVGHTIKVNLPTSTCHSASNQRSVVGYRELASVLVLLYIL